MTDFERIIYPKDHGYDPSLVYHSSPSHADSLAPILDYLQITSNDSILDVGCGKGSAMKVFMGYPFSRVDGIELMEEASKIAIANFQELQLTTTIETVDATQFNGYDKYNYFYLFNPFPSVIFEKFLSKLESQVARDKQLTFIYSVPSQRHLLENSGYKLLKTFPLVGQESNYINIYRK